MGNVRISVSEAVRADNPLIVASATTGITTAENTPR